MGNLPDKQREKREKDGEGGGTYQTHNERRERRTGRMGEPTRHITSEEREGRGGWGNIPGKHLLGQSGCQTLKGRSIFSVLHSESSDAGVPRPASTTAATNQSC